MKIKQEIQMNDYSDTKEFILKQASEHDVKFIRLWFTDILGRLKGFAINIFGCLLRYKNFFILHIFF